MDQILFVDKPKGITSFDVIRILRKKLGVKKAGHAGTLDPAATGLLIVGVEQGTKKLNEFAKLPKTYLAQILFGKKTATGDLDGEVIEEKEVEDVNTQVLEKVLKNLVGEVELPVPLYSAVKISGQPLYKYARKGIKIEPPKRKSRIFWIKLLGVKKIKQDGKNFIAADIEIEVEKGTYIRAVAEEIGRKLRLPATLQNLRRTSIGKFKVENAEKIGEFLTIAS